MVLASDNDFRCGVVQMEVALYDRGTLSIVHGDRRLGSSTGIARYRETDESAIIQEAVETGVETLWRDVVVSKYLNGDISRDEACNELGVDSINRVDQAKGAIREDIEWGLDELRA